MTRRAPIVLAISAATIAAGCSTQTISVENALDTVVRVQAHTDGRAGLPRDYPPDTKVFDVVPGSVTTRTLQDLPATGVGRLYTVIFWRSPVNQTWRAMSVTMWEPGPYTLRLAGDRSAMRFERLTDSGAVMPADRITVEYLGDLLPEDVPKLTLKK
ncbi:MAG: hypothetical protein KF745_08535 [Phycisphaeraceae bacterium]|nr:hypothetical protein [Phycisphaeraceae bacterium]